VPNIAISSFSAMVLCEKNRKVHSELYGYCVLFFLIALIIIIIATHQFFYVFVCCVCGGGKARKKTIQQAQQQHLYRGMDNPHSGKPIEPA
jgi:hypothetical protein